MFKDAILYRTDAGEMPASAEALAEQLALFPFAECGKSQSQSAGWVPPRGIENGPLVESIGGQWLVKLKVEQRGVPSQVVKRHAEVKAKKIEEQTGRRPKGKALRELREEVYAELLPQAFSRELSIAAWIDPKAGIVVVDAGSSTRAEMLTLALISSAPRMNLAPVSTAIHPPAGMASWLFNKEGPADFTIDRTCELKQPDSEKAVVRYARHTLDIDEVGEHIKQGKLPTKLAMTFNSRVSFVLMENMHLRQLSILDGVLDNLGDGDQAVDGFDADVAIFTGEMQRLIPALVEALGGYCELPIMAAQKDGEPDDTPAPHVEGDGPDPIYPRACTIVRTHGKASISLVQRHLRIGYNRAARLLERMESEGLVTPMNDQGARTVVAANDVTASAAAAA